MAITSGNWSSSTDPFLFASEIVWSTTVNYISSGYISLTSSEGIFNEITNLPEIQEVFWQKDSDKENMFNAEWLNKFSTGPEAEFGSFRELVSSSFITVNFEALMPPDPVTVYVATTGKASGATLYSLFIYAALCWAEKDPAQILFSWIAHYIDSPVTLKDYLDQTSFEDASDYYDDHPCRLTVVREEGSTIADQAAKLMSHVSDFCTIRPSATDGAVTLHLCPRHSLNSRTSSIDLESQSVRLYEIQPSEKLQLDVLRCDFGSAIAVGSSHEVIYTDFPIESPGVAITQAVQKVGPIGAGREAKLSLPYYMCRSSLLNHMNLVNWNEPARAEVYVEFADWTHLNFDCGDKVPIVGRGYDGTEVFVCTEKSLDMDTLLARCRFVQIYGTQGRPPAYADGSNLIMSFSPNGYGYLFDSISTYPKEAFLSSDMKNSDRWMNDARNLFNGGTAQTGLSLTQFDHGTLGDSSGYPNPPQVDVNQTGRWPGVIFPTDLTFTVGSGLMNNGTWNSTAANTAGNYSLYVVLDPDTVSASHPSYLLDFTNNDDLIFALSGGGTNGKVQYYDGSWHGTKDAITGLQILSFILNSTAGSRIRRNGSDIETGVSYTQRAICGFSNADVGVGCNNAGTAAPFYGNIYEMHLFYGAHYSATIAHVEDYLAAKYGITI